MFTKIKIPILACAALALTLCSCSQSQVNSERLPADSVPDEVSSLSDSEDTAGPKEEFAEINNVFVQEDFFGYGQVNYYMNDVELADSLEDAGIDKNAHQLSGSSTYDYYVAVSLTIENVSVPVDDEAIAAEVSNFTLINSFKLYVQDENENAAYEPIYFDRGGEANSDAKRYFGYRLPNIGETLDVVIAFGISGEVLSGIKENDASLFLLNSMTMEMMRVEGLI